MSVVVFCLRAMLWFSRECECLFYGPTDRPNGLSIVVLCVFVFSCLYCRLVLLMSCQWDFVCECCFCVLCRF